jgi:hypothetical protein
MTTPPFYSEERWGLYHVFIISRFHRYGNMFHY